MLGPRAAMLGLLAAAPCSALGVVGDTVPALSPESPIIQFQEGLYDQDWPERDFNIFCANVEGCWPATFLLGAQKCGTTAIATYLTKNDLVRLGQPGEGTIPPPQWYLDHPSRFNETGNKEPHAFDTYYQTGSGKDEPNNRYTKMFPNDDGPKHYMDATPNYFGDPDSPRVLVQRMPSQILEQTRFVVVFREPIARSLSWFNHVHAWASENDPEVVKEDKDNMLGDPGCFSLSGDPAKASFDEVARCSVVRKDILVQYGEYDEELASWVRLMGGAKQRKNLLVLSFDTLAVDPHGTITTVNRHIGIPSSVVAPDELDQSNVQASDDKIEVIKCSTLAHLRQHYDAHNQELYDRLSDDRANGYAPEYELDFPPFEIHVPCSDHEIRSGDLHSDASVTTALIAQTNVTAYHASLE